MNGKTAEEILRERKEAINIAKDIVGEEIEVLETFFDDFGPDKKPLHYLAARFLRAKFRWYRGKQLFVRKRISCFFIWMFIYAKRVGYP